MRRAAWLVPLLLLMAAWLIHSSITWATDSLVLYCAHDLIFAQEVIDEFERQTGIFVRVVGDTEATKSLGLTERLIREKDQPVADVFWNNQVLGTVRLRDAGVLASYKGPGFQRIPEQFKDSDGYWTGFAGRFRVWIVNTQAMEATTEAVVARITQSDLSRVAIAVPLYGTTLSQFSLLWKQWGAERVQAWHADLQQRGCRFVQGNATVKNLVAEGHCDLGMTDTDDAFVALDDGRPVVMLPLLIEGRPVCIPNSVALIRGAKHEEQARRLIDYLLSEEVELQLARSQARQVPLGPTNVSKLPEDVQPWAALVGESHPSTGLAESQLQCLDWLKQLYLGVDG